MLHQLLILAKVLQVCDSSFTAAVIALFELIATSLDERLKNDGIGSGSERESPGGVSDADHRYDRPGVFLCDLAIYSTVEKGSFVWMG